MNISERLYSLLSNDPNVSSLVGTRIFPIVYDKNEDYPLIVYNIVDQEVFNVLNNANASVQRVSIQLDVLTTSYPQLIDLKSAVITSLKNDRFTFLTIDDYHEEKLDVFGSQLLVQTINTL